MSQSVPGQTTEGEDGRVLITAGRDFGSRTGAMPVIISRCVLRLRDREYIGACEAAFLQFEGMLRKRRDEDIRYEWANVYRTGLVVDFEIYWYDEWFFEERREAYRVGPHPFAFQRFGAVADDFQLTHEKVP